VERRQSSCCFWIVYFRRSGSTSCLSRLITEFDV
jgi:hypothetical protein